MKRIVSFSARLLVIGTAAILGACADEPLTPNQPSALQPQFAASEGKEVDGAIAMLQRVTARYHNVNNAIRDGFVLLHPCEERPGEGPVGTVYVHIGRLMDGVISAQVPDALIYEPRNGYLYLAGAEFAIPYALWPGQQPPTFQGATFQREDEFGVYALHAWVWIQNPNGLFAETNPRLSCGT